MVWYLALNLHFFSHFYSNFYYISYLQIYFSVLNPLAVVRLILSSIAYFILQIRSTIAVTTLAHTHTRTHKCIHSGVVLYSHNLISSAFRCCCCLHFDVRVNFICSFIFVCAYFNGLFALLTIGHWPAGCLAVWPFGYLAPLLLMFVASATFVAF